MVARQHAFLAILACQERKAQALSEQLQVAAPQLVRAQAAANAALARQHAARAREEAAVRMAVLAAAEAQELHARLAAAQMEQVWTAQSLCYGCMHLALLLRRAMVAHVPCLAGRPFILRYCT